MSNTSVDHFLTSLREVLGHAKTPVTLHEPEFSGHEQEYVKECIDSGWVSSVGKFVDRFEAELWEVTGVRKAVACANGTAALQVAYQLVGVERGDEVLMPTLTFIATANAASYLGAIPHFVESREDDLGVDIEKLDLYLKEIAILKNGVCTNRLTGRRIKALVVMHVFGHPVDLDAAVELCARYSIALVEDAAEALGSKYKGKHVGHHGVVSTLSFNGNKVVTTGGGGAIITNDEKIAAHAKHLTTTARVKHAWDFFHDEVGYNYRMPNLNAALGCAQLERLAQFVSEKRNLAVAYERAFKPFNEFRFVKERAPETGNYWLNAVQMKVPNLEVRNAILQASHDAGFHTRPLWILMHHLPIYGSMPRMELPIAEKLEKSLINIPSSPFLGRGL
jgi:perosamine synthetase